MDKKPIFLVSAVVVGLIVITVFATFTSTAPQQASSATTKTNAGTDNQPASLPTPTIGPTKWDPSKPVPKKIAWEPTFEKALAKAEATGKPVMVDFFATWCGPCKYLDQEIYTNKSVIIESTNFINVKVDADKRTDIHIKYQIEGLPTIAWMDAKGTIIKKFQGAPQNAEVMADIMRKANLEAALGTSL